MSEASFYPGDWIQRPLGEVCQVEIGGTPSRSIPRFWAEQGQEGYPWVAISDLGPKWIYKTTERITRAGVKNSNVKLVPKGTVLMSFKLTLGRVGIAGIDLYTNEAIAAFYSDASRVTADWLYHILPRVTKTGSAEQAIKGQTLNKDKLQRLILPLPPLSEQRCIAAVLDTAGEAIRQTERVIAKLKAVKAGLLHDLLTRGLDEHGHLRDPQAHPEQFKDSPLGRIPREWEVERCESICQEITVGIVIKPSQYYVSEGVPALRSANLREDGVVLDDLVFISEESNRLLAKSRLKQGDVITVRTGYPGTSCVVPPELDGANCIDLVISRLGPRVIPEYLATWINSDFGKGQVLRSQGGLAQQHFNVGALQKLLVALPKLDEQNRIAAILDAHDARIRAEESALEKLRQVKHGLMDDLLTGKVRVKL